MIRGSWLVDSLPSTVFQITLQHTLIVSFVAIFAVAEHNYHQKCIQLKAQFAVMALLS